eukprot:5350155-Amphidinium_carterae.1
MSAGMDVTCSLCLLPMSRRFASVDMFGSERFKRLGLVGNYAAKSPYKTIVEDRSYFTLIIWSAAV